MVWIWQQPEWPDFHWDRDYTGEKKAARYFLKLTALPSRL